jgi:hypothetical protein
MAVITELVFEMQRTQQTGARLGNYLAKVGVEGSSPFARSRFSLQD